MFQLPNLSQRIRNGQYAFPHPVQRNYIKDQTLLSKLEKHTATHATPIPTPFKLTIYSFSWAEVHFLGHILADEKTCTIQPMSAVHPYNAICKKYNFPLQVNETNVTISS